MKINTKTKPKKNNMTNAATRKQKQTQGHRSGPQRWMQSDVCCDAEVVFRQRTAACSAKDHSEDAAVSESQLHRSLEGRHTKRNNKTNKEIKEPRSKRRNKQTKQGNQNRNKQTNKKGKKQTKTETNKVKGAEARSTLPYVKHLLRRKGPLVAQLGERGVRLRRSVLALSRAYSLMQSSHRCIDADQLGKCFDQVSRSARRARVPVLPKFHLARHLGQVAAKAGNPRLHSAYADESHNFGVVRAAQAARTANFTARILSREILRLNTLRG